MLTFRGSFLLGASVLVLTVGILASAPPIALLGLSLLFWIWQEWLAFARFQESSRRLVQSFQRTVDGDAGPRLTLVTDRRYSVILRGDLQGVARGYRITARELVPVTLETTGTTVAVLDTGLRYLRQPGGRLEFEMRYSLQTPICGLIEFPGVQLELTDYAGLFRSERFAALPQQAHVLPFLIRPQTTVSVLKHNNLQQHLGHHRHRSSGISSELHGIRDYQLGDPPRTIAWKPTARLGRLMTCEYENEVPIRATLLVDLAAYQFEGRPGPTAGDRAISTTASLAKLLLADRDPVAALLLGDRDTQRINHGSGERQLARLLQFLLRASNPHPPLEHFYLRDLIQVVFENACRRFPELFDERFNHGRIPFGWFQMRLGGLLRIRRSLALALEQLLELPCGTSLQLQCDDQQMRMACLEYVRRFSVVATSTSVALDPPYRDTAAWLKARNQMTARLCEHLTQVRLRAKDNELFVVVAPEPHDLVGNEMLEAAIKNVVAAKHRVVFIAPEAPLLDHTLSDPLAIEILQEQATALHRQAQSDLGHRLKRMGVLFARIDDPQLMQLVAMEVGLLQSAASRAPRSTATFR